MTTYRLRESAPIQAFRLTAELYDNAQRWPGWARSRLQPAGDGYDPVLWRDASGDIRLRGGSATYPIRVGDWLALLSRTFNPGKDCYGQRH
jgi:hypothetical protein